jgi:hypothetical protein
MKRTFSLGDGRSITFEEGTIPVYESIDDWTTEAKKRFGDDFMKWKFVCPMCGHVASIADFKAAGAEDPNCAYSECLGRYQGKGSPKEGDSSGCNWCAYGLFGIPKGGCLVKREDGTYSHVFDFAPEK